jgi:ribose transport system ATP-binding protein
MTDHSPIPRLSLRAIRKHFGATIALDGVDLDVWPGEVHAIIGENGAGKSTLMKILSGVHSPDSGEIIVDGLRMNFSEPRQSQLAGISMIYQELNLAPDLSVAENITLGREPQNHGWISRRQQHAIAQEALARLNCYDLPLDSPVRRLSVAHQQIVEIARAMQRPASESERLKLLILDEPTSSLAKVDVDNLFAVIQRLKEDGVSVLYISHFLEECERVADRFTVLRDGRSVASGTLRTGQSDSTSMREIIRAMVGREIRDLYPKFEHGLGEAVLRLEAIAGRERPREVSMTLRRGEIFGIAGLIGAGRTETLRVTFGLDRLVSGKVIVHGNTTTRRDPVRSWQDDSLGFVSEDRKADGLLLNRSLVENLSLTRTDSYRRGPFLDLHRMREATRKWMAALDVRATDPDQSVGELSGGNQQKIAFGRLLHHDCDILLLDEPTRGIDIGSKSIIYKAIGELAAAGKAILLASSYLPELLGICNTIGVVSRGRLVDVKPRSEWNEHSLLAAAIGQAA